MGILVKIMGEIQGYEIVARLFLICENIENRLKLSKWTMLNTLCDSKEFVNFRANNCEVTVKERDYLYNTTMTIGLFVCFFFLFVFFFLVFWFFLGGGGVFCFASATSFSPLTVDTWALLKRRLVSPGDDVP